ncbi:transcriptional regulator, TetR family [Amycolatopsis marina]|uniref:Transcriptional regulator, TetR family n=1 Tax=Amycolatopsis marina TaxID=490629 RepID=A0A1I0YI98_9PSEU|nr:TetR/AcrR family transcriptional regulator [Amycolatopsis marina]SFB13079.1 transcriptional regulator, TetR family [Amycolatopsis marina]
MSTAGDADRVRRPRDRRRQISVNARELFAERGFHSVRMSDIAEATGITPRALYRHYTNKQALLLHVLFEAQDAFLGALPEITEDYDPASLSEDLCVMARASLVDPHMARLWKREARHIGPEDSRELRIRLNSLASGLAHVIGLRHPELAPVEKSVRAWAVIAVLNSHNGSKSMDTEQTAGILGASALAAVDHNLVAAPDGIPDPPPATRSSASRREQLINIAAMTFRRQGFDGASVDGIAAEAGMAGPAIYRYFDSKTAMLATIANRFTEWVSLETVRGLGTASSDEEALTNMVSGYVRLAAEAENLLAVTVTEAHHLPEDLAERLARSRAEHLQDWAHWLRKVCPERSDTVNQLIVHTARVLIDDTVRTRRVMHQAGAVDSLVRVATAVMRYTQPRGRTVK